jgi:hypothetical protein
MHYQGTITSKWNDTHSTVGYVVVYATSAFLANVRIRERVESFNQDSISRGSVSRQTVTHIGPISYA